MIIKAVIYDLDDTLIRTSEVVQPGIEFVYHQNKNVLGDISISRFKEANEVSVKGLLPRLKASEIKLHQFGVLIWYETLYQLDLKPNPEIILALYESLQSYTLTHIQLYPEVMDVFDTLISKNIRIAILSNGSTIERLRKVIAVGLQKKIDLLVATELVGRDKPDQAPFLYTLNLLGVKGNEVIYIGDSYTEDICGATNAGIQVVHFNPHKINNPSQGDYFTITNHKQLLAIINKYKSEDNV
ncbi:hypothetical protein CO180_00380 [candidate division WWE3 bacterium CG_4_9_14_3_um_filter_41_6]|uniref:HAD family hydrolase n=1 Tax=candidate division WWE3 bacterium CG_4_10_14_0_2_um_filter_41_14 TaxID=1975072 RepID=A0A2M7TES3_UNCKA|nr:MAG: hypothetical protein COY32_06910 [candidate division WWE3 bacterium CG_4_10_14_0_2_um_filter_41_14]PJA39583.1 MAG: hypothetical protein CO180_00380 [candidate division WWE3 bacterium CG_4_9_14_3_um_filter_41_6]